MSYIISLSAVIHCLALYVFFPVTISQAHVPYPRFSTKSSYNLSRELDIRDGFYDHQNSTQPHKCLKESSVVHVTAVFRHGTRFPSLKDIKYARSVLEKLKQASLNASLYARLDETLVKFPKDNNKDIAPSGIVENDHLGERFGTKYSKFFASASEKEIDFYATSKNRTVDSFRGFLNGFKRASGYKFNPEPAIRDDLLRFFDNCDKYVDSVDKNESAIIEAKKYMSMMQNELVHLIEVQTGTKNLNLTSDELDSLLDVSGCEDAIFNSRNWVEIMSERVFEILNYVADLEDYWKKGPGFAISYEQSCILVSQIFKNLDTVVAGDRSKKGSYYFSHAETLYPMFGLLGIFVDHPPLYHNNSAQRADRMFRSTRINPFASNIAFVLHNCSNEIFVELLFKEEPLNWPVCNNSICPYSQVRPYLANYIDKCNFEEMCEESRLTRNGGSVHQSDLLNITFLLFLVLVWRLGRPGGIHPADFNLQCSKTRRIQTCQQN